VAKRVKKSNLLRLKVCGFESTIGSEVSSNELIATAQQSGLKEEPYDGVRFSLIFHFLFFKETPPVVFKRPNRILRITYNGSEIIFSVKIYTSLFIYPILL